MKHLFVMDRPGTPMNIDLFRTWEDSRHFRDIDLYTLNDLLSNNFICAPEHYGRDAKELYQIEINVIPVRRAADGTIHVLGRSINAYHPTEEDLTGENLLDLHNIVDRACSHTIMNLGLRVRHPDWLQENYLTYGQLRGNIEPIVAGIGTYHFTDDRGRIIKRYNYLRIEVFLMLKNGLLDEIVQQTGHQVFVADNWGNPVTENPEWDHLEEAGIGSSDVWRAIKASSFDQTVFLKPGLE